MLYYFPLYQGEGISGPTDVGAGTGPLYSCMGIAFVNRARGRGGLYHYPASTLDVRFVQDTITQMFREIEPDQIVVTPAQATGPGMGSRSDDLAALMRFLRNRNPSANVDQGEAGVSAQLVWSGNQPTFNRQPHSVSDDYDEDTPPGTDELRAQRSLPPRSLGNNVLYYGVDGENNPGELASSAAGSAAGPSQVAPSGRSRFKKGSRRKWIRERCIVM